MMSNFIRVDIMKRLSHNLICSSALSAIMLFGFSSAAFSVDVCGSGTGEPPFLSYGVNSNLLMLIDNSGSMLDMGYIDTDTDGAGADRATQCFDEGFIPYDPASAYPSIYAGNFKAVDESNNESWYKWVEGIPSWRHKAYVAGDIVYYNGILFRALTAGTSNGETIYKDQNVDWDPVLQPRWNPNKTYHPQSFVFDTTRGIVLYTDSGGGPVAVASYINDPRFNGNPLVPGPVNGYRVPTWSSGINYPADRYVISGDFKLYYTEWGGISNGTQVTNDQGVVWIEVDYFGWNFQKLKSSIFTAKPDVYYYVNDIATWNGMVFRCKANHLASGNSIYDDNFSVNWERLDEGYFEEMASKADALNYCEDITTPAPLLAANNKYYSSNDVCVTVNNPGTDPQHVLAFAASGNLLNWASASKFDIQKSILTGGKYDSEAERIIGESRGCAGKSYIKQVPIQQNFSNGTSTAMQLTMKVRGPGSNDMVDSSEDTTRLEIYAITQNGLDFDACQLAIDFFTDPTGVAQVEQNTALCVGFSGTGTVPVEHVVYHKAMQACWYLSKQGNWKGGNDHLLVAKNCEDIYLGNTISQQEIFPANIGFEESTYVCYGIYDGTIPSTSREGYIGRCWKPGDYVINPLDSCQQVKCGYGTGDWDGNGFPDPVPNCTNKAGSGLPCYFAGPGGVQYRCSTDKYLDSCNGNWSTGAEKCTGSWVDIFHDNFGAYAGANCTPSQTQDIGFWEADFLGDNDKTIDGNANTAGTEAYNWGVCADRAMRDYCSGLNFPEVIDPSDQASSTEEAWNLPGILVDAAIVGQLGEKPLLVTKGYILPSDPATGTLVTPSGILQEKAGELRIGAMAFNANGALYECNELQFLCRKTNNVDFDVCLSDPAGADCEKCRLLEPVNRFCPMTNLDGAQVITPIKLGSLVTDTVNNRKHVDDLVATINAVQATSWTPLAEALYTAIGYYTMNDALKMNWLDFQVDSNVWDWMPGMDYGKGYYVRDPASNKIYQTVFGGRSSTTGTGPLNDEANGGVDWIETGTLIGDLSSDGWSDGTTYNPRDIVLDTAKWKLYITYTGGVSKLKGGAAAEGKSGPLFDEGVVWEPLVDPVARWCQDNNILIITEGASTADINPVVAGFLESNWLNNGDPIIDTGETDVDSLAAPAQCTNGLQGSTYLDDMTFFAKDPNENLELYPTWNNTLPEGDYPFVEMDKQSITTHIVVAGTLRDVNVGTDPAECNPREIMFNAAENGGTRKPIESNNPSQLRKNLEELFNAFRQRASAGSAASVISSARGGEGAIYQAIFWPELAKSTATEDYAVAWAGDVHGLFLDNRGYMYEDTDGDRANGTGTPMTIYEDIDGDCGECPSASGNPLIPDPPLPYNTTLYPNAVQSTCRMDIEEARGEDIDGDGHYDCVNEDLDNDLHFDSIPEDTNNNCTLDSGEDLDGDNRLDMGEWCLGVDKNGDGVLSKTEDLDGDGYFDTGEDTNHNGILDAGENIDGDDPPFLDLSEDLDGDGNCSQPWGADGIAGTADDNFDPFVDVDGDGRKDIDEDFNNNNLIDCVAGSDRRVIIFFSKNTRRSMACYDTSVLGPDKECGPNDSNAVELSDVNYLWSAAEWLSRISPPNQASFPQLNDPDLLENRSAYNANEHRRYIFTWNDLNNDGIVPTGDTIDGSGEVLKFESSIDWDTLAVSGRGPVSKDFDLVNDTEIDKLIIWMRGQDWPFDEVADGIDRDPTDGPLREPLRSRLLPDPSAASGFTTWRLGDIIHSTPMTVASPAEGYHLIYNDFSYAQFLSKYRERRHVVYFGANDGMLHAVNAGFYNEEERKFCLTPDKTGDVCTDAETDASNGTQTPFELGTELWAYVPYNLLPHLKCLAEEGYNHKYFLDQRPRIFDVQIFQEEGQCRSVGFDDPACIHPNGWGTILVGGMRFGGAPIQADQLTGHVAGDDDRIFSSSWFILDITSPEVEPTLLGELSFKNDGSTIDLGYTTGMPTMAIMKEATETYWYLVFGSGPHGPDALKGVSDQDAKIAVLPLDRLVDRNAIIDGLGNQILQASAKAAVRIPAAMDADGGGTIPLAPAAPNGFVSDMITVDYDINPSYEQYKSDVIYFGTVEGDFATKPDGRTYWNGGGKMYRLVTKEIGPVFPATLPVTGSPYGRGTTENMSIPANWEIKPLIDLTGWMQPITAAASVGTDGDNFWVYFGTGRFFDADDKTDDTQHSYYGIREPALIGQNAGGVTTRYFTWDQVDRNFTSGSLPGDKGLWDTTDILIAQSPKIYTAALSCIDGTTNCIPPGLFSANPQPPNLKTLQDFIGGTSLDRYDTGGNKVAPDGAGLACTVNGCTDGWVRDFLPPVNRERNVGQATLLGGLVTFTTYQPFNDVCQAEGNAFLYAEYYRTGTAWHKNIFGLPQGLSGSNVSDKLALGRGLATTPNLHVGAGDDTEDSGPKAFVQTSTGEILEIEQENLPIKNYRTGRSKWKEYIQ